MGGSIADIDLSLCTHTFYSYVKIGKDSSVEINNPNKYIQGEGYTDFIGLWKKNPKLKTLVFVADRDNEMWDHLNNK